MLDAVAIVHRWVELYNDGTPDTYGSERFLELYAPDVDWREMPSGLFPEGRSGDLAKLREALHWAMPLLRGRHITLHEVIADAEGRRAAFRFHWTARLAVDLPPNRAGDVLEGEVSSVFEVKDGRIVRAVEYFSVRGHGG
jgi:ketosteroid isomerase-like protein